MTGMLRRPSPSRTGGVVEQKRVAPDQIRLDLPRLRMSPAPLSPTILPCSYTTRPRAIVVTGPSGDVEPFPWRVVRTVMQIGLPNRLLQFGIPEHDIRIEAVADRALARIDAV